MFPGRRAPGSPRTSCTAVQDKLLAWFTRVFYLVSSWTPLQDDASLNSPAQHSPCPTDLPVRKHSLFSFGSLLPVRHPMITLNNSSPSAHVSSQVPGSSIPPGRLYIACSWGLSSEVVLSHPFIIFSPLWTSSHLFISLYSPNDKSNPHK